MAKYLKFIIRTFPVGGETPAWGWSVHDTFGAFIGSWSASSATREQAKAVAEAVADANFGQFSLFEEYEYKPKTVPPTEPPVTPL